MNFKQLEYIIAVDKHRNFNRASIDCDVAQSTLSREIQRLEKEFDIIIFDRSRTPVVPTLKGIDLIKKARDIRLQQKEFIQIALKRKNEIAGQIILAIAEILAPYITPIFIKSISKKYPKLEIRILELSDRRIKDLLISQEVDAAIMVSPSLTQGHYKQKLYEEELCIYSTNEINNNSNLVSLSTINIEDFILHQDLKELLEKQNQIPLSFNSNSSKKKSIKYIQGNLETLKNIININGGSMFLPKIAVKYLPKKYLNRVYSFMESPLKLDVSLVFTRGFEKKRIIKRLFNDLSELTP